MPPLYDYSCPTCGWKREEYRSIATRNDAPTHCGVSMKRVFTPPMIIGELDTYRAVAADKETGKRPIIDGRKQHREFLRRNNYEEWGTEPFVPTPEDKRPTPSDIDVDLF